VDTGEQAYGRAAMRLQIKYTPERTVTGGVAFAVDAPGGPIVITSAHIVATMSKGKKLESSGPEPRSRATTSRRT
jgi:hypothetical protein